MPYAPATNQVFVPKAPASTRQDQEFMKFASKIDPQILD